MSSALKFMTVPVDCPRCGLKIGVKVPRPEDERVVQYEAPVKCVRCLDVFSVDFKYSKPKP